MPIIIAIISKLDKPAKAKIPRVDRIQSRSKTVAISRKGLGKSPINQETTIRIKMDQRVMGRLLMLNKTMSGRTAGIPI